MSHIDDKSNKLLNKVGFAASELGILKQSQSIGQFNDMFYWKDGNRKIEFKNNENFPSIFVASTQEDIVAFKNIMDSLLVGYKYTINEYNGISLMYEINLDKSIKE